MFKTGDKSGDTILNSIDKKSIRDVRHILLCLDLLSFVMDEDYLLSAARYIEINPVKAG